MLDRSLVVRPLGSILGGALVFAAGLALALAWVPEWRAGRLPELPELPEEARFVERYRALATQAGVHLAQGAPRVALGYAPDDLALAGLAKGRGGPRAVSPRLSGFKVTATQEATLAGDPARRVFSLYFAPDSSPVGVTWTAPGFAG